MGRKLLFSLMISQLIFVHSSCAFLLEIDYFLDIDRAIQQRQGISEYEQNYYKRVQEVFQNARQLEIGGTHFTGNRAAFQSGVGQGQLDPSIIILNPDKTDHDKKNQKVLSIKGSGWDLDLLKKLITVTKRLNHRFDRIFINNLLTLLPIPEGLPNSLSAHQNTFFTEKVEVEKIQSALLEYFMGVKDGKYENLYQVYSALLADQGVFLFQSGSSPYVISPFSGLVSLKNSFYYQDGKPQDFIHDQDQRLFLKIETSLQRIGDFICFPKQDWSVSYFDGNSIRFPIFAQTRLLEDSGFNVTEVGIGKFKDYGWNQIRQPNGVYSLVIEAKKLKSMR